MGRAAAFRHWLWHRNQSSSASHESPLLLEKPPGHRRPTRTRARTRKTAEVVSAGCSCGTVYRAGVRRIRRASADKPAKPAAAEPCSSSSYYWWEEDAGGWNVFVGGKTCPPASPVTPEPEQKLSTPVPAPPLLPHAILSYSDDDNDTLFSSADADAGGRTFSSGESSPDENRVVRPPFPPPTAQRRLARRRKIAIPYERLESRRPRRRKAADAGMSKKKCKSPGRSHRRRRAASADRNGTGAGAGAGCCGSVAVNWGGPGRESVAAVVKKSRDPYADFKASMLEMIVEKEIFAVRDLQRLLRCFVSLNSPRHHDMIVSAFSEICSAVFSIPPPTTTTTATPRH